MKRIFIMLLAAMLFIALSSVSNSTTLDGFFVTSQNTTHWVLRSDYAHVGTRNLTYQTSTGFDTNLGGHNRISSAISHTWDNKINMTYDSTKPTSSSGYAPARFTTTSDGVYYKNTRFIVNSSGHITAFTYSFGQPLFIFEGWGHQHDGYATVRRYIACAIGEGYGLKTVTINSIMNYDANYCDQAQYNSDDGLGMEVVTHTHKHYTAYTTNSGVQNTTDYSYVSNGNTKHKVNCSHCNAYFLQDHTPTYTSINSYQHRVSMCLRCSYSHTYTENHTLVYSASTNNYHCTFCGYTTTNPGGVV